MPRSYSSFRVLAVLFVIVIFTALIVPVSAEQTIVRGDDRIQAPGCAQKIASVLGPSLSAAGDTIRDTPGLGLWGLIGGTALSVLGGAFGVKKGHDASLAGTAMRAVIAGVEEAKNTLMAQASVPDITKRVFREKIEAKATQHGVKAYVEEAVHQVTRNGNGGNGKG